MSQNQDTFDFDQIEWKADLCFECLGVKIGVRATNSEFVAKVNSLLPEMLPIERSGIVREAVEYWFSLIENETSDEENQLYKNGESLIRNKPTEEVINLLQSHVRLTVAEYAQDFVFLHAGVVSWKGEAIIIPGKSFSGKTTLVTELVKRNCDYFSDEYAVIDKKGFVHPFPKKLSIRGIIDDYRQVDIDVEEFGGKRALKPVPVRLVLLSEYNSQIIEPSLKAYGSGEGMLAIVANSISVRHNPKLVLEVLSLIANRAIILQAQRGGAADFADFFFPYLEGHVNFPNASEI